jgi:flagella basal body P-ring formation protein FlgA
VTTSTSLSAIAIGLWFFAGLIQSVSASGIQSLESIQSAAEKHVAATLPNSKAKYFINASNLDSRLRLAACAAPLQAFSPTHATPGARTTVGVRCDSDHTWTIYVSVSIEIETSVLVLRRGLARRARVETADVELQVRRLPGTESKFITDIAHLQGHRLKRALSAGSALTVDVLAPDILVRRGQQVTLIAASGTLEIRAQGHAISEGGVHDRIRVRNTNSLKIVEGVVENADTVRVDL